MDSLKKADNLEAWIYSWIDALLEDPSARFEWPAQARAEAWRQPVTRDEQGAWFYLLANDGYYQLQHGNIIQSLQAYEEAYRFYQTNPAVSEDEVIEFVLKPLGNNYTRLGDYERAMFIQEQGYQLARSMGNRDQQVSFLINMASTARTAGKLDQAAGYGTEALELVQPATALQGLLFNTLADITYRRGDFTSAWRYLDQALKVLSNPGLLSENKAALDWLSGAHLLLGQLQRQQLRFREAEQSLGRAVSLLERRYPGSKQRERAKIWLELGETQRLASRYSQAKQSFDLSIALLVPGTDSTGSSAVAAYADNTIMDAFTGKARIAVQLGQDEEALGLYHRAFEVSEALRLRFAGLESKQEHQRFSLAIAEEAIAAAFRLYQSTGQGHYALKALDFAEWNKARILADELRWNLHRDEAADQDSLIRKEDELLQVLAYYETERIQAFLAGRASEERRLKQAADRTRYDLSLLRPALNQKYPLLSSSDRQEAGSALALLPPGMEVWEYFTGNEHWYFFRADSTGVLEFRSLGAAAELGREITDFLERYFHHGPQAMYNDPEGYYAAAHQIYRLLLPAGRDHGADGAVHLNTGRKMIIPDGIIGKVPFEALPVQPAYSPAVSQWPFLIREVVISRAYSLDVWNSLQATGVTRNKEAQFAGFFVPFDEAGQASTLASLPAVRLEMDRVREHVDGVFFQEGEASSGAFFEVFGTTTILHLSTHAFLLGENQIPALQFADRQVYIPDIYRQGGAPELVVLSACQTGIGPLVEGEGVLSLAREFAAAGAGGIVAGLWNLNDETAAELTGAFYRNLRAGGDKALALHTAKLDWLDNPGVSESMKLPYHWAALVYSGNNQPVHFRPDRGVSGRWMAVILLVLVGGAAGIGYFVYRLPRGQRR